MKINVQNFKGIEEFEFETNNSDIIVLTGENSGGKTSFIQSLLMIAQSIQEGKDATPIIIDGKFLKLGGIESIIKQNLLKNGKYIKYTMSDSFKNLTNIRNKSIIRRNELLYRSTFSKSNNIQSQTRNEFLVDLSKGCYQLEVVIMNKNGQAFIEEIVYTLCIPGIDEKLFLKFVYDRKLPDGNLKYLMETNNQIFLKKSRLRKQEQTKYTLQSLINSNFIIAKCDFARIGFNEMKPHIRWKENEGVFKIMNEDYDIEAIEKNDFDYFNLFEDDFKNYRLDTSFIDFIHDEINLLYKNILYIGPLREYPESLYIRKDDIIKDIGIHGENAGAILAIYHNKNISYPIIENGVIKIVQGVLKDAVKYWLCDMFNLAQDIKVNTYKNNSIYEIEITNQNGAKTSINNVGFGISQILPIIVQGLISEKDQILIFEQPEIHLHPKVQSILFDFIRAISSNNRKVIVETHSDHFITRLRRRVVENKDNFLSSRILLLFAENNELKEFAINEYGYFNVWPKGFFDQDESELSLLISARAKKKIASNVES